MKVRLDHLQPTPVGATVVAEAMVEKIEGRRITFTVSASDERGLIAVGRSCASSSTSAVHGQVRRLVT